MNTQRVWFAFFIVLALTLNFGFFVGEIDNPHHHNPYEFFFALVVSLIATVLKIGDRSHLGAVLLATSLVADLQLIAAAVMWGYATQVTGEVSVGVMASVVSLAGGAMLANVTSVVLLIAETIQLKR
ncbi:MAG: hypothetical protein EBW40_03270 [Gammaproteobacteria bacterium]|jgi:hypothetical protein|nr:hypothetical protein [Gammaproteobacteria bacterium]NCW08756.1 hypothetical protein [Gammaproteobacteria bacterium]NCW73026.1 hypothetical protein [Gammaproteobacteria bacterium]NCX49219.1 hypothetical protein [Gammaproteobacteria bacterium]